MVTITNLKLPASWVAPAFPNDNNFDIRKNKLGDFLEGLEPIDWGGTNFVNVGTINGLPVTAGGGGINLVVTALLREEFAWTDATLDGFIEQYLVTGGVETGGGDLDNYGIVNLNPNTANIAGARGELSTDDSFVVDMLATNSRIDLSAQISVDSVAQSVVLFGVKSDPSPTGITDTVVLASIIDGFGFICDGGTSANWQIWSKAGGVETRTTTTTAVNTNTSTILQVVFDQASQTINYFVNGLMVGQITTNISTNNFLFIGFSINNKIASDQFIDIGMLEIQCARVE